METTKYRYRKNAVLAEREDRHTDSVDIIHVSTTNSYSSDGSGSLCAAVECKKSNLKILKSKTENPTFNLENSTHKSLMHTLF
jgi:hypothetical protein